MALIPLIRGRLGSALTVNLRKTAGSALIFEWKRLIGSLFFEVHGPGGLGFLVLCDFFLQNAKAISHKNIGLMHGRV